MVFPSCQIYDWKRVAIGQKTGHFGKNFSSEAHVIEGLKLRFDFSLRFHMAAVVISTFNFRKRAGNFQSDHGWHESRER